MPTSYHESLGCWGRGQLAALFYTSYAPSNITAILACVYLSPYVLVGAIIFSWGSTGVLRVLNWASRKPPKPQEKVGKVRIILSHCYGT